MTGLLIVDRIAGGQIICETPARQQVVLPPEKVPPDVREGDCLRERDGRYHIDRQETERRRARNRDLFRSLLADEGE